MSKTIFITGASSGLGKATAKLFAAKSWNVLATMRQPAKETELTQLANVTVLPLDVTRPEQVRETIQGALKSHGVDVVFNNAGYGLAGPMDAIDDARITRQFETNVFGPMRVTREFIPYFKQKRSGRFITTTSVAGLIGLPLNSVYNASKWALEGWSEGLSYELAPFGIKVKTVAPGAVMTDFMSRSLDHVPAPGYDAMNEATVKFFVPDMAKISSAESIAQVVWEAATDDQDHLRYVAGDDAIDIYALRQKLGNESFRQHLASLVL